MPILEKAAAHTATAARVVKAGEVTLKAKATPVRFTKAGKPTVVGADVFDGPPAQWGPALDARFRTKVAPNLALKAPAPPSNVEKPLPALPGNRSALDLPRAPEQSGLPPMSRSALDLSRAELPPLPDVAVPLPATPYERTRARIKATFQEGKMAPAARVFHALTHPRR
jgi:hypothetical protein